MNIGIVVTPENPVPPVGYGGGERVADVMVRTLMQRGHNVTLFCCKGSTCPATGLFMVDPGMRNEDALAYQALGMLRDKRFDVVVDRAALHLTSRFADSDWPVIGLMCGDPLRKYPHDDVQNRVYVSEEFASFNGCEGWPVLRNPICMEPEKVPCGPGGGPIVFVGPIHPIKGIDVAAAACRHLGETLVVYGPVRDKEHWQRIQNEVDYRGILEEKDKDKVLGNASVFVHPTQVCDADPGAPKEAMLRGTPVVACKRGGIASRIMDGNNGYFADSPTEFAAAIEFARLLDREHVRWSIIEQCNPAEYGRKLEALCERVAKGERW